MNSSHPLSDSKAKFRAEVEKSGLQYTFIFTGLFYEFHSWIGFDIKKKKKATARIRVTGATLSFNELLKRFEKAPSGKLLKIGKYENVTELSSLTLQIMSSQNP
ncbi:5933_t:CDS:2 [Funneliformis geosporum]|uniref:11513_t:CDS:1 n=1 Tax=Funneliformis geosporum TaxID=1117311 RepID=A0A9W4WIK2_9GLOM|nr:11513_t:CDS:2 [Funneliformis geosporum]CAI2175698.1 5933_t:CDS:2 [Funneliformis geosporum]